MKRICKLVAAFVALIVTADSHAQNFTNKGKEFWVGYGHHQYMEPNCDGTQPALNNMNMVLYLSNTESVPANVTVTLENSGQAFPPLPNWSWNVTIPANTVIQSPIIPKGGVDAAASGSNPLYDARLFDNVPPLGSGGEKVWTKHGIHIVSNTPIVAYAHIYGGVASGATMLLPVETWGYSYTSVNSEQTNAARSSSWMYVIAKDNNTRIRITPTVTTRLGKPAGVPFTIDLQKGQIYQVVAPADCNTGDGPELTGTKVKSIVGADGICHPIAVFSGSGRTLGETFTCGTTSGRDNDMQQAFPEHAWGKRYATAPFSKASGSTIQANQFQTSVYKIILKEPGTIVRKNGVPLTISGNVFKYSSNTADYIEANKPIMVAQFMSGSSTCNGGNGDPEMIYLSPIEQAINTVGFFRNTKEAIVTNYLTLIVPTAGLASLRIDNSQLFDHTYAHPNLPGYSVVVKGWQASVSQSIVTCDSAFNAFTYGLGSFESYGFNAGTNLKNLNAEGELYNKPDTSGVARPFTCVGTPMELTALVAYQPTSMVWKLSSLSAVMAPNADVTISNPTPSGTVTIGAATYYRYKLPGTYVFNTAGKFDLPIVCTSTDIDNCALQETLQITIDVKARPSSNFTFTHSGCRTDSVSFTGPATTGTYSANGWSWNFGDNTTSVVKDPKKVYGATGTYQVSLVVTSNEGCLSDTTRKPITISPARVASIFATPPTGCEGATITFSDTTTVTSGNFWWDFGVGAPVTTTSNTPQTVTYATPGTYKVRHVIHPTGNCVSDTVTKDIIIYAKPAKPAAAPQSVTYCQNAPATALSATALTGNTLTWYNAFPLTGGSATAPTPSTTTAGTSYYYVTQTNANGCVSDTTRIEVVVVPAISGNTISANQTICSGSPAAVLTGSPPTGGAGNNFGFQWQSSTDGGTTWTNISGATNPTYSPGVLSTGTTKFRRVVTSGVCSNTSNVVDIVVETNLTNYDISASQAICAGATPALLVGQSPTGGTGVYAYQWQASTDNVTWTAIANATLPNYQPGPLTVQTYFRRVTSGGNCPAISSVVTITINPTANGTISTTNAAICQPQSGSITFTPTAGTAPFTIQYQLTAPGGGTTTQTQIIPTNTPTNINVVPANSTPGTYTIALTSVSDNGNCVRTVGLNSVTINVTGTPAITFNPAGPVVCFGTSANITAAGATIYAWSPATGLNATTGATVTANPTSTTTYTVTGTTNGCSGTGTVTVTVNQLPAKPAATVQSITYCQNATATALNATATAGSTLTWYAAFPLIGGSANAPTPSTATAGTFFYYVTQTNTTTNCVSDTTRFQVIVTPSITNNTIGSNQTLCSGLPAAQLGGGNITGGTGMYAFQWQSSTDGGATWTNIPNATSNVYDPGTLPDGVTQFRRVITSGLCSSTSNVVSVTMEVSLSNFQISAAQTICEGSTPAALVGQQPSGGTGNYNYQWSSSVDGATWTNIPAATNKDYQPPALTASTFYRRTTSGGNCPAISTPVLITVNPIPNGTLTGPAGICSYESGNVTFTPTGAAPFTIQYTITGPNGTTAGTQTVTNNNAYTFNVLPLNSAAGTYTIQLTSVADNRNCARTTGFAPVTIVVTAKPSVSANVGTNPICEGASTSLTGAGATTYTWSPNYALSATTGNTIIATPPITTAYQLIGTTNGCSDTTSVTVNVIAKPTKPTATRQINYCQNATATALTATATAGNTLTWYTAFPLTGGSATAPTPSTSTVGSVTYYVTQKNSNNCVSDTAVITVVTRPLPTVNFDLPAGICMPNGAAVFTNRTTISDNSNLSYTWNFGDGSATSNAVSPTHVYSDSNNFTITLTATSPFGCTASLPQQFNRFFNKPVAGFDVNPTVLCQGQDNFFTDNSDPRGSTITRWWWSFGDGNTATTNNPRHRYNRPDTFTVKLVVTTAIGCVSDTFDQDVTVFLQPKIDAGPSFVVPAGTTIQFKATANDTSTVRLYWTPPFGLSDPTKLNPTITVTRNERYTLTAIGDGNCTASDTMMVRILQPIEVPNAFSPNGDGTNDRWEIPNLADYPGAKVEIFNRWGQQVYLSYGYNRPWDGTHLGKPLPLATYYYIITLNNGFKPVTGSVTIIK